MAWIRTVSPSEAVGLLKMLYDTAFRRAGRVFQEHGFTSSPFESAEDG